MKKILFSLVLIVAVFATNAQTKVSKTTVVGKWSLAAMDVDGMLFYDIDKDSLSLGSAIMTQLAAAGQDSAGAVDMMKEQLGAVKDLGFEFLADGTYKANGGPQGSEGGTYAIDESTETITMTSKKSGEKKEIVASFKDGKLMFNIPAEGPGPKQVLYLKVSKD